MESLAPFQDPVLDLGCGDGLFAGMLTDRPRWLGIDSSKKSIRQAKKRGSHSSLILGEGGTLPFSNGSIATVVSNSVLEHIPDVESTLAEVFRVLSGGGRFIMTAPSDRFAELLFGSRFFSRLGLEGLGKGYGDWFNRHSRHFHTDSISVWRERLENHGFVVIHSKAYFSERAHHVFDIAHYLGVPRLVTFKLTGTWVLFPGFLTNRFYDRWLAPHVDISEADPGAYLLIEARKPD